MNSVRLANGVEMPILGLGVYQARPGETTEAAVRTALELGYRHIDTAALYGNERDVGDAIKASGVPRKDVFVTTKLWNSAHGHDAALLAFEESLRALGLDYVDLYLIHWPVQRLRNDTWRALEQLYRDKRVRAIGVSNYMVHHLEELLARAEIAPHVDQVELSPFCTHEKLRAYAKEKNIQIEAYSPLTQGQKLKNKTVVELAVKYARTPAQIMLRWAIEHGIVVIPKSVKKARIEENQRIFDFVLAREDLKVLDALDEDLHVCWDPTTAP